MPYCATYFELNNDLWIRKKWWHWHSYLFHVLPVKLTYTKLHYKIEPLFRIKFHCYIGLVEFLREDLERFKNLVDYLNCFGNGKNSSNNLINRNKACFASNVSWYLRAPTPSDSKIRCNRAVVRLENRLSATVCVVTRHWKELRTVCTYEFN
jgi:hypothetical protein